jgi:hypothetical protein
MRFYIYVILELLNAFIWSTDLHLTLLFLFLNIFEVSSLFGRMTMPLSVSLVTPTCCSIFTFTNSPFELPEAELKHLPAPSTYWGGDEEVGWGCYILSSLLSLLADIQLIDLFELFSSILPGFSTRSKLFSSTFIGLS